MSCFSCCRSSTRYSITSSQKPEELEEKSSIEGFDPIYLALKCGALELNPEASILTDSRGNILKINSVGLKNLGYLQEELKGKDISLFMGDSFAKHHSKIMQESSSRILEQNSLPQEYRQMGSRRVVPQFQKKDGSHFPAEIVLKPIIKNDNVFWIATINDRTEIVRQAAELEFNNIYLAHEAGNSSAVMASQAEFAIACIKNNDFEAAKDHLGVITTFTNISLQLINLILGRPTDPITFQPSKDFSSYLYLVFKKKCADKNINFTVKNLIKKDLYINGYLSILQRALYNLVSNSLKFSHQGTITVTIDLLPSEQGPNLFFSVQDDGDGISEENHDKIFSPRGQVQNNISASRSSKFGGFGIGLSALRKDIESILNGKIWLTSSLGKGSTFHFQVPANIVSPPKSLSPIEQNQTLPQKNKPDLGRILIVDDSSITLKTNHHFFKSKTKSSIQLAESAEDAFLKITSQITPFDLIVTDENMGKKSGMDLTKDVRAWEEKHKLPPCLIFGLSGDSNPEEANQWKNCGANGNFIKGQSQKLLAEILLIKKDQKPLDKLPDISIIIQDTDSTF